MSEIVRVTLIGPECSGKTTLAAALAGHFGTSWSPEYARLYVEQAAARAGEPPEPSAQQKTKNEDLTLSELAGARNEDLTPSMVELSLATVGPIALGCVREMERAIGEARRVVIHDTDLVSTVVYSRHYYGEVEEWIEKEAWRWRSDHYLLLAPEFSWSADGVRDRPSAREQLYLEFREALEEFGADYTEIAGSPDDRLRHAVTIVEELIRTIG